MSESWALAISVSGGRLLASPDHFPVLASRRDTRAVAAMSDEEDVPTAPEVTLNTSVGPITVELYYKHAPKTCQNFLELAKRGYYDGVPFHRIIADFMIQGGDPTGTGRGGQSVFGAKFEDEITRELKHTGAGILSMANSGPNTNGSQFFITLAPTPWLDGKHTIFGRVSRHMGNVAKLGSVRVDKNDKPVDANIKIHVRRRRPRRALVLKLVTRDRRRPRRARAPSHVRSSSSANPSLSPSLSPPPRPTLRAQSREIVVREPVALPSLPASLPVHPSPQKILPRRHHPSAPAHLLAHRPEVCFGVGNRLAPLANGASRNPNAAPAKTPGAPGPAGVPASRTACEQTIRGALFVRILKVRNVADVRVRRLRVFRVAAEERRDDGGEVGFALGVVTDRHRRKNTPNDHELGRLVEAPGARGRRRRRSRSRRSRCVCRRPRGVGRRSRTGDTRRPGRARPRRMAILPTASAPRCWRLASAYASRARSA